MQDTASIIQRLRDLRTLDEKVRATILGHPIEDRHELHKLQSKIHQEIRQLRKDLQTLVAR